MSKRLWRREEFFRPSKREKRGNENANPEIKLEFYFKSNLGWELRLFLYSYGLQDPSGETF